MSPSPGDAGEPRWRHAPGVVVCAAEDEVCLLVRDAWETVALDPICSRVWELLAAPLTISELVVLLVQDFDVTVQRCRADLEPALIALGTAGALLIEE